MELGVPAAFRRPAHPPLGTVTAVLLNEAWRGQSNSKVIN